MSDQYRTDVVKSNFDGKYTVSSVMVTTCGGIAIYSSLEMVFLILTTFKKWKGLYFWSLSLCNLGILMYAIGFMMVYFEISSLWLSKTLNDLGWIGMVVCQSLVLYSRLGLIVSSSKILKSVKWMIIVNSVILVPFPIIFDYGIAFTNLSVFPKGFFYLEHIQITMFSLQECIISTIYVVKTIGLLKVITKTNTKGVMRQLLLINLIIIPMDIVLIVMQFKKFQLFQEGIKVFVYAVKVKLELHILSKLVDFIQENERQRTMMIDAVDSNVTSGQGPIILQGKTISGKGVESIDTSNEKESVHNKPMKESQASNDLRRTISTSPSVGTTNKDTVVHSTQDLDFATGLSPQFTRSSSQRLRGRESDAMYADVLRSI